MGQQGAEITLGSGGQEQPGLFAKGFRYFLFQGNGGGVIAIDIIPHLSPRHGSQHAGRRARHGIAAQIHKVCMIVPHSSASRPGINIRHSKFLLGNSLFLKPHKLKDHGNSPF